ncbi:MULTISPECIES: phosphate ABC transporter substrate-binding protein [Enterococcus]|uniref:Phosphate-binding protein n=1 Tax=Enterococcus casseliflavus TaxID=37734 RepID=A0ABD6Z1K9_ENTCA|nr:phosphate ABC transporter substrate-binding protein [Enterococcus casseliflavus]EOH76974.1 phosphate binding protein [Enterococcus casseliflavus ATCC 49996]EOU05074.1 phosphate-binding protein [Enterococcus casseliflavus ATCC 49996]MBE9880144.1 phosphate ABC transporter substrate-binding protein [Enterococcus casseliflavus]MDT2973331.1 phosphate ABC transporter substrate-binding protein [Enterococcus casseliflavus]QGN30395.1 phosphate ABC transporter substrate-binding protein PstS family pr
MKKLGLLLFATGLLLAGCGSGGASTESSQASGGSSSGAASNENVEILAVGSTALQPLVEAAGESFSADNPNYTITVQGGGSGTGLSQVEAGAVTIGNSDVFADEKDGVDASKLVDHKVAVVGMAPVVNKDAGVTDLSQQDLIDIFTGKVKNWSELGGADQEISVINRASGSGTRATFEKWGLDGAETIQTQEQDSSGTVRKIVAETPGAISYLALSYLDDSIQALSLDGVEATPENIADNKWPIWSYEHMYTNGEPDANVKAFLDYIMTDDVQQGIVIELGYLPITDMKVERSVDGEVTNVE